MRFLFALAVVFSSVAFSAENLREDRYTTCTVGGGMQYTFFLPTNPSSPAFKGTIAGGRSGYISTLIKDVEMGVRRDGALVATVQNSNSQSDFLVQPPSGPFDASTGTITEGGIVVNMNCRK